MLDDMDEPDVEALTFDLQAAVDAANEQYRLSGSWKLVREGDCVVTWQPEGTGEKNKVYISDAEVFVGPEKVLDFSARRAALGMGRLKEMRKHGFDLSAPPIWSYVSTPILSGAMRAHAQANSQLAHQEVEETLGVISCSPRYEIRDTDGEENYHFAMNHTQETLRTPLIELPEAVWEGCVGRCLSDLIEIPGIDLSRVVILAVKDDPLWIPEEMTRIIHLQSPLVRLSAPPAGIIADPVEAWLRELEVEET